MPGIRTSNDHDVRDELADLGDGVLSDLGPADDQEVLRQIQGRLEPFPGDGMVVHDEDADPLFVAHAHGMVVCRGSTG
jgi:hypothetical protein